MSQVYRYCFFAIVALLSSILVPGATLRGATLAQWETFQSEGNQVTQPASNEATGVVGNDMTRNGGLTPNDGDDSFNSSSWAINSPGAPTDVNTGAYVELGISVQPGFVASLDSLLLGSRSSGSGPAMIGVFTSDDNFASPIHMIDQTATTGFGSVQGTGFANSDIDLTALSDVTGDFRVRFMNISGPDTATLTRPGEMDLESTWRLGDFLEPGVGFTVLQITGDAVAIPEPSTFLLCGTLFIGAVLLRARKTRIDFSV